MSETKNDIVVVAAPRASMMEVERAGPAELPDSKRCWKIEKQEEDLTGKLGELEQGTRRRNREFEAKLRSIEERIRGAITSAFGLSWWPNTRKGCLHPDALKQELNDRIKVASSLSRLEAGILQEIREREETHAEMSAGIKGRMAAAVAAIEELAESSITSRFEPGMHDHVERLEADEGKLDDFVNKTVPRTVDEQSGAVTRKLQKAQETFDIENAKIQKREQKIMTRFGAHVKATSQSFEDEKATRTGKLWSLGEDLEAAQHMDDRGEDDLMVSVVQTIKATRQDVTTLSKERARQDGLLLDSLAEAQQMLQRCILETFGAGKVKGKGGRGFEFGNGSRLE